MKMNETILAYALKSEEKYNIRYAKKDGALFAGLKTAFILSFIYAAVFAIFTLLIPWVWDFDVKYESATTIPIICAFLVLGAVACVFCGFKNSIGTALCALPVSIVAVIEFAKLEPDPNGLFELNTRFYWAHLLPIFLMVVFALSMLIIELRARYLLKRSYLKISERLYAEYSAHAEKLSEEEWEEFLKAYDPRPGKKQKG